CEKYLHLCLQALPLKPLMCLKYAGREVKILQAVPGVTAARLQAFQNPWHYAHTVLLIWRSKPVFVPLCYFWTSLLKVQTLCQLIDYEFRKFKTLTMFIEPNLTGERRGWIEVVCGSMFSGKTEELIRRLKRVKIANLKVEIFKPAIDTRYDEERIVSHDENKIMSTPIENSRSILMYAQDVDVVGIDEAQFFDDQITYVCEQLAL